MTIFDGFLRAYREANDGGMALLNARDKAAKKSDAPRGSHDYRGEDGRMDEGSQPVSGGYASADEGEDEDLSEAPGEFFPRHGGGDASGKMAYPGGRKGDGPAGFRDSGKRLAPEAEHDADDDSRRGASDGLTHSGGAGDTQPLDQVRLGKVRVQCPACERENIVRLPKHLTVVRGAYAGEGEGGGKLLKTQCGGCSENIRFRAPEGHRFANRESAAVSHFKQRYGYLTGRAGHNPIVRGLRSAREAFRRTYFDR